MIKSFVLIHRPVINKKYFRAMATNCLLACSDKSHVLPSVQLPNWQNVIIGRSPETKIKDKRCSRKQVEFTANYETYSVEAKQIGPNSCGFKDKALDSGDIVTLHHDDVIEVLSGQYPYRVTFIPPPPLNASNRYGDSLISSKMPRQQLHGSNKRKRENNDTVMHDKYAKEGSALGDWENYDNNDLLVLNKNAKGCNKIAAYDMDGTLITTSSGRVFPTDNNDWKIHFPEVPGKLKALEKDGYKIVIFTNQAGVAIGKNTVEGIQTKIRRVLDKLGVDGQALVSIGKGKYRKPAIGMWDFFLTNCNEGVEIDATQSFYVGDAAGRPEIPKKRKKDHSCADRLFALNLGLQFFTPEEHFQGHKPGPYKMPDFLPNEIDDSGPLFSPSSTQIPSDSLEVIIMVGFPGSGKSFFVEHYLLKHGYIQVNRDTLGSWQKCVSTMENALKDQKSVVVDNTNPDRESRKRYIEAAQKLGVPVRCFIYDVTLDHAMHNNKFRELAGSEHSKVNVMVYNMYKSKFEEPTVKEGFTEIVKVNFKPIFKNKEMEKLYRLFLLEK